MKKVIWIITAMADQTEAGHVGDHGVKNADFCNEGIAPSLTKGRSVNA